jgi:AraC-like DNA-binding protein
MNVDKNNKIVNRRQSAHSSVWPGTPVSLTEILPYLEEVMAPERLAAHQHYAYNPSGGTKRSAEILCKMRLCWFVLPEPMAVQAKFEGVQSVRELHDGDIFIGGYNGFNRIVNPTEHCYSGFSIIFHLSHIRLHYISVSHGRELCNIYFHTRHPATGVLALLVESLDHVIHEVDAPRFERCRTILAAILTELRYELTTETVYESTQQDKTAMRIKSYLDHNYFRPEIDCTKACDELELNRTYASSIFHVALGITMNQYLTSLRLEAAEALLSSEDRIKIKDVAQLCAFASESYFIKVFRARYGISPGEYRVRSKANKLQ